MDLQALNYNDSSIPKAKADTEFRILSFGDSFCHAIVQFPASYNGVAQALLSGPERPMRIVNFGEPSSSFPQYIAAMANWAGQIAHDALLVNIFLGNDLSEAARGEVPDDGVINRVLGDNFVDVQTGRKRMSHVPRLFALRMADYVYAHYLCATEGQFVLKDVPPPYTHALGPLDEAAYQRVAARHLEACDPQALALLARGYEGVAALGRYLAGEMARGLRVLVMLSPAEVQVNDAVFERMAARMNADPARFDRDLPNRLVAQALEAAAPGIPVLDLTPVLRQATKAGACLYYPMETHWNVEGNKVAGKALADWIKARWLVPHAVAEQRPGQGAQ
ncbi:MAG: alginate O-acetyltransferase AlgX-related protein [Acidobacteriota bacterium]